jgi:hypothetical protein
VLFLLLIFVLSNSFISFPECKLFWNILFKATAHFLLNFVLVVLGLLLGHLLILKVEFQNLLLCPRFPLCQIHPSLQDQVPHGFHLASTATNESSRLVGGSLSLPQPSTTTNESSRLVDGSLGFHLASTTTNESSRLVGGSFSFILILWLRLKTFISFIAATM